MNKYKKMLAKSNKKRLPPKEAAFSK